MSCTGELPSQLIGVTAPRGPVTGTEGAGATGQVPGLLPSGLYPSASLPSYLLFVPGSLPAQLCP